MYLIKKHRKTRLAFLAFVVWFSLSFNPQFILKPLNYGQWCWIVPAFASLIIIYIFWLRDSKDCFKNLGINFKWFDILGFITVTAILSVCSYYLVDFITRANGYTFKLQLIHYKEVIDPETPFSQIVANYIYYIPQTFNEEMLIGAFLLLGLERRFTGLNRNAVAVIVALIFGLMHKFFYMISPAQSGILLTFPSIVGLFLVGLVRNALILKTRKITYSWALHLAFNLIFFGGYIVYPDSNIIPSEPERFNIVFGNTTMLIFTGFLATVSIIWLNSTDLRKGNKNNSL